MARAAAPIFRGLRGEIRTTLSALTAYSVALVAADGIQHSIDERDGFSPENWRASSSASSITTAGGVFSSFISYTARRRMLRSTAGMRSMRQFADFAVMR